MLSKWLVHQAQTHIFHRIGNRITAAASVAIVATSSNDVQGQRTIVILITAPEHVPIYYWKSDNYVQVIQIAILSIANDHNSWPAEWTLQ